jgi:outer membrane lipase/esterase
MTGSGENHSMKLKHAASAAALCVALLGAASAADAQTYNRLVVFGDSLSDNGNLYLVAATPTSPPYFAGRFSNGPTWVELLGFSLSHFNGSVGGNIDLAFGGAETGTAELPTPRGIRRQLTDYQAAGGTFGSGDLVTVWGGANNIFNNFAAAAVNPNPTGFMGGVTNTAAADLGVVVNTAAAGGAGTILVANLPELANTPQFNTNLPAIPLANFASTSFNMALKAQMNAAAAAHPNTNIIQMDVYRLSAISKAHPELFGFTNVTARCFNGVTVCANPDQYQYWDSVHPTAAGHRLLASLAADYLEYGDRAQATVAEGEAGMRHRDRAYDSMLELLDGPASGEQGWSPFLTYDHDEASVDARGLTPSSDEGADSVRLGVVGNAGGGFRAGGTVSYTRSKVDAGALDFDTRSYGLDVFAGWRGQSVFVDGVAGAALDDYQDIRRQTGVGLLVNTASTDGWTGGAKLRGGMRFEMSGFTVSPRAAISWSHGQVAAYSEDGFSARHSLQARDIDEVAGELTVRVDGHFGDRFGGFVEAGYGDSFSYDADPVRVSLVDNSAHTLSRSVDEPEGGRGLVRAGLEAKLCDNASLGLAYRGRFGDSADSHLGSVTLKLKF